ncbi:MAG TPA: hypothetical protein VGQ81_13310, partial [Acidobacteriota bacterium]|nr:hypothetical protein [Acidobacteriota bacterium]
MNKFLNVLYIVFCFQVGLFLLVFPWMRIWEANTLLFQYPAVRPVLMNNFFRGAVSGLGIINLFIGCMEVMNFARRRNSQ